MRLGKNPMASRQKARLAFISAIVLLILSGAAGTLSIDRLLEGQHWVAHTYEVEAALGAFNSAVAHTNRARQAYVATQYDGFLQDFEASAKDVPSALNRLKDLTRDNPREVERCNRLEEDANLRIALFQRSVDLKKTEPQNVQGQDEITRQSITLASSITENVRQMEEEERFLLNIRNRISNRRLVVTIIVLALSFLASLAMFLLHYRLLSEELGAREKAERAAHESEALALQNEKASQKLSARLLQIQDEERRKFSRDLHDSLGQYLAGAKMHLGMLGTAYSEDQNIKSCIEILDQSIAEVRTMSHLLHPPLLDEVGFEAAASWFVEGFSKRSGIAVALDMPRDMPRLPAPVELALFRVLQESLTNIHRHAKATKAEISLQVVDEAVLRVRDNGVGFPPELLNKFKSTGTNVGVGLAGMRERTRDVRGRLEIESSPTGTLVSVTIPLDQKAQAQSTA
jgi:signal transduction histidine kinase